MPLNCGIMWVQLLSWCRGFDWSLILEGREIVLQLSCYFFQNYSGSICFCATLGWGIPFVVMGRARCVLEFGPVFVCQRWMMLLLHLLDSAQLFLSWQAFALRLNEECRVCSVSHRRPEAERKDPLYKCEGRSLTYHCVWRAAEKW